MPSRSAALTLLSGLLALSLSSCSTAPKPKVEAQAEAKIAAPASINLLCHEGARAVRFDKIGVPDGERPADVALTRGSVWVLFAQGRLVQLSRGAEKMSVRMHLLPAGERWNRLAVDPVDESVWAVSQDQFDLYKVSPQGQVSVIKLQRKIEGTGGFYSLVVGRDALYVQPTCADTAVWRIDRSGKVLDTAFEASQQTEVQPEVMRINEATTERQRGCANVYLEKDAEGRILVWDDQQRATYQADEQGKWTPSDSRLFTQLHDASPAVSLKGVDVGKTTEQWYFTDVVGDLFFWKGQPVYLGSSTLKERSPGNNDTVLFVPGADSPRELLMTCNGLSVSHVATDATGYAALTRQFLILGDVAGAPDLP